MELTINESTLVRFLLGELPEEEMAALEERFFRDDSLFDELRAAEAELVDRYVRGELSGVTLQQFERHFLKFPERRQRVDFARSLAKAVDQVSIPAAVRPLTHREATTADKPPGFQKWLAMAAVLMAAVGVWLTVQNRRLARQVDSIQGSRTTEETRRQGLEAKVQELQALNADLSAELERERNSSQPKAAEVASLVAFVLSPGMVRGTDEPARIVIPHEIAQVKLQLDLETVGDYLSYRGELRTAGGQLLWSQDGLQARSTAWGKAVVLTIPSVVLRPGEHELTLRGLVSRGKFEDSGYYYFSVMRR